MTRLYLHLAHIVLPEDETASDIWVYASEVAAAEHKERFLISKAAPISLEEARKLFEETRIRYPHYMRNQLRSTLAEENLDGTIANCKQIGGPHVVFLHAFLDDIDSLFWGVFCVPHKPSYLKQKMADLTQKHALKLVEFVPRE